MLQPRTKQYSRLCSAVVVVSLLSTFEASAQSIHTYAWDEPFEAPIQTHTIQNIISSLHVPPLLIPGEFCIPTLSSPPCTAVGDRKINCDGCNWNYIRPDGTVPGPGDDCYECTQKLAKDCATESNSQDRTQNPLVMMVQDPSKFASYPYDSPNTTPLGKFGVWKNTWFTFAQYHEGARFGQFLAAYKSNGGRSVDLIAFDIEDDASTWRIVGGPGGNGPPEWDNFPAILNDPRSATFRSMLPSYQSWEEFAYWWLGEKLISWNAVAGALQTDAMTAAYFNPSSAAFPGVRVSNHGSAFVTQAQQQSPDWRVRYYSGFFEYGLNANSFGNEMAPVFYGQTLHEDYGTTAFDILRYDVNRMRQIRSASPDKPITPWVDYAYNGGLVGQAIYHREVVFHLALNGAKDLLFFNPHPPRGNAGPEDEATFDGYLEELYARIGDCTREPAILSLGPWTSDIVVSGAKLCGTTWLWRVTVQPGVTQVHANGTVLTINPGEAGVWYVTNTAAQPVFTPG